jgi:PAS domain-containing protein
LGKLVVLFIALIMVVPLTGLMVVKLYAPEVERETYANLQAIAKLKADQIENWLSERHDDGRVLMASTTLVDAVDSLVIGQFPDAKRDSLQHYLDVYRSSYGNAGLAIFRHDGQVLMQSGVIEGLGADMTQQLQSMRAGTVLRSDLYRDANGHPHIHWLVPVGPARLADGRPVAAVVIQADVNSFIYPVIQTWPTASPSGETLLVRHEGTTALFLNDLRHRKGTAMVLAPSMDSPGLPAAAAIRANAPGTTEGIDYREKAVFAAYRPVAGTTWHIVAKMDQDEVFGPLRTLVFWIVMVALAAVSTLVAGLYTLWRQQLRVQRMAQQAQDAQLALERSVLDASVKESHERAQMLMDAALDAVVTIDEDGTIISWNAQAEPVFGHAAEDAIGRDLADLIVPPSMREAHRNGMARYLKSGKATILG